MDDEISSAYESQLNSQVISTPNHNALVFLYSDDTSEPLQPIELVQSSSVEAAVDKIMAVHNDLDQLQLDSYYVQEELTTFMFRLDDIDTAGDLAAQSLRTNVLAKVQATLKELQTPSSGMLLGEAAASLPLRKNSDAAFFKSEEPLIEFDSPSDTSTNSSEIYYDILHSSSSTDEFFKSVCDNESSWVLEPTQTSDLESSEELRQGCDDIQKSPDAKQEDGAANMILSDTELQTLLSDLNIKVESFDLVEETEQQLEFDADIPQGELVKTSRESSGQASKDSCKSELGSEEGPVQLLLQDADGKFSLNEEALHYVLAPVKDKKLAIVSIVGAFRRGKSFILNFLLRYLKAGGASDWLEGKGENNDLTGFSWRGGRDRDTTGILLWSQPFLMGDDLAVLLMDTQGTFDSLTSMNENAFMFALSTLASSVQIYNLSERIQMDDLQNLQYFLEFGRLVHDASNSKVFSKLLFLVRDWRYPEELKFGFEGGAHLLNEVFKSQVGKMQVEMLNTCFDEVECCLLPHPGEAVFDDQHFKGSPNDMRPEFVSYLWLLVEHIFQPGNLPAKKIGDIFVTGEELQAYLCTFVERLQSSSLSPKTLFQALSNTANERARKKALAFYTKEMEVRLGTTEDIAELHKTLYSQALQMFDSACCFGEDKDTNPHRLFIMELLEDRFNQLVSQFAREEREHANEVRYHLSEAANRAVSQYRLSMELDQSVADLEHSHQQLRVQALMIFEPLLAIYPLHLCKPYISQAKQDIEKLYLAYKVREEKTLKQRRADMLREAHTAAIQNYQLSMEKNGAGVEALPDLEKLHESVFASALAPLHFLHDDSEELGQCLARAAEVHHGSTRHWESWVCCSGGLKLSS